MDTSLSDSHADFKTIGRASCPFYAAFRIVVQAFNNSPRFVLNSRNRCECITLSNAAFASRSTRCPFCFSSVNILYASSTGRAAFMGDDPFINLLCVGFCILWINGCILSLITASTKLYIHICSGVCTTWEFRTKRGLLLKACTTMRIAA